MASALSRRLAVARGDEPADLVVQGGRVFSVFTREWLDTGVAVVDGYVAGLGEYEGEETLDASGRYVVPGFVDAHMHLESSKLLVDEFARLVLPFGTTAVVADPHEIANVLGTDGVHWLLDVCGRIPLDVWFMASSCVPASMFESPRRELTAGDLDALLRRRRVLGLAEMMNFPGVINGDERELEKLALARHVDGHAPGVLGRELNAYIAAGIRSDHEAYTPEEGRERLRARDVAADSRGLRGTEPRKRCCRCSPSTVRAGSPSAPTTGSRSTSPTTGTSTAWSATRSRPEFRRRTRSSARRSTRRPGTASRISAPSRPATRPISCLLPDLERFVPETVLKAGRPVAEIPRAEVPDWVRQTVRVGALGPEMFRIPWSGGRARVIGLVPGQIVTESLVAEPTQHAGEAIADPARDLAKIAVIERHLATGRIGLGFVRGFGLQRGAIASTVAHDAHNVVVVGTSDASMAFAVRRLANLGGGIVAVDGSQVVAELPLPVAGLLSDGPLEDVVASSRALVAAARELGCTVEAPFQLLAFLALSVIPSLKLTDRGLVDVDRFELVPLEVA